jgi:hypothetical protein
MTTGYWSVYAPEAGTTLARNPSTETNTTLWTVVGGSTITRSLTHASRGHYSAKVVTAAAATSGMTQATAAGLAGAAGTSVTVSADVWVESETARVSVTLTYTVGSLTTAVTTYSTLGAWNHYEVTAEVEAGKTLDSVTFTVLGTNGTASTLYVDALQIEQTAYATSYMDGDQPGVQWTGTAHGSTSVRSAQYRGGGRLRNVVDYCEVGEDLFELGAVGVGLPPLSTNESGYATLPGGQYQSSKADVREFTLVYLATGTPQNRQAIRSKLRELFDPLRVSPQQPVRLVYTGNSNADLEIEAVYVGGLEWAPEAGAAEESIPIRLRAYDPFFYETVQDSTTSAAGERKTLSLCLVDTDGIFTNLSATLGTTGNVYALCPTPDYLYIGGSFTNVGDANGDYIVRYSWATGAISSMGTGLNGDCNALYWNGTNLIAGGAFTAAGGVANTRAIAYWDGSAWQALGTGCGNGLVYCIDGLPYSPAFAIGGTFTACGGVANTKGIAVWSGAAWTALTDGTLTAQGGSGPDVRAILAVSGDTGSDYYVSGLFSAIDTVTTNNIAAYVNGAWTAMGSGLNVAGYAWSFARGDDGTIYLGGAGITSAGGTAGGLFAWNGTSYTSLFISGVTIYRLRWWDGTLWMASDTGRYAYSGGAFHRMPTSLPNSEIRELARWGNKRYLGLTGSDTVWSSIRLTVTNNGTAVAYPRFLFPFESGETHPYPEIILNETTGQRIQISRPVLGLVSVVGTFVEIDLDHQPDPLDRGSVPGRKHVYDERGGAMRLVDDGSNLATFGLAPGSNNLTLYTYEEAAETQAPNVGIAWRTPHAGVDE